MKETHTLAHTGKTDTADTVKRSNPSRTMRTETWKKQLSEVQGAEE